jgi:sulfite exporter TauE/SafE
MELWTAFLLGLVGSLHCAGMCGPLALALPPAGNSNSTYFLGRAAYNFGRVITYCMMGVVFGLIGKSLTLVGIQRWASIALGVV